MSPQPEAGKAIVRQWVKEVFNEHQLDSVEKLKVPEYTDWNPYPGQDGALSGFKTVLAQFLKAFPDFHYDVHEELEEGDIVVCIGTWSGTHLHDLMGMPATNKRLSGRRIDIVRYSDDKMTERWGTGNELKMMQLLGLSSRSPKAETSHDAKAVAARFVDEVLDKSDLASVEELVDDKATQNARGTLDLLLTIAALSDVHVSARELVAENDQVKAQLTISGKQNGEHVTRQGTLALRVVDGKIVEGRWDADLAAPAGADSSASKNGEVSHKPVVKRFTDEVLNERRLEAVAGLMSPDAVDYLPESMTALAILRAFPDFSIKLDRIIEEGDRVVTLGSMVGTHTGTFLGVPGTGKGVDVRCINVYTVKDGKIVDSLYNFDLITMINQLNIFPIKAVQAQS